MRIRPLLFCLLLVVGQLTIAQTTVQLAGACTDCAAVITSLQNCSVASAGTLKAGTPVGAGVTQTIQVVVGKVGKYSFLTSNNGIIFTASGTFTATGTQTVVLTASGYAASGGVTTFTLTASGQSCTFNRTVDGPTTVINGPCPSNLKFWRLDEVAYSEFLMGGGTVRGVTDAFSGFNTAGSLHNSAGNLGITTDSVLYALPYMLYGKNNYDPAFYNKSSDFRSLIISPTRVQNVPKVTCIGSYTGQYIGPSWVVGADGNLYFLAHVSSSGNPYADPRYPSTGANFYPYSYVGNVTPNDTSFRVMRYPKPPTGTKWTDVSVGAAQPVYALNDLGEMYSIWVDFSNYTTTSYNASRHLVKISNPFGTDPATFKYTRFHGRGFSLWVVVAGNDGNYYSFSADARYTSNNYAYSLGWGPDETSTLAGDVNLVPTPRQYLPLQNNIRKMAFPPGTVLADDSRHYTVDGKMYVYGQIASGMGQPVSNGIYYPYPLADGDYSVNRPDVTLLGSMYRCTTPRLVALPNGATRFYGRIYPGYALVSPASSWLGSSPIVAATDNGVYGLYPEKVNKVYLNNNLAYMEVYTPTSTQPGTIYYPKYVASDPAFASYFIPRNQSNLGLDGTVYAQFFSLSASGSQGSTTDYVPYANQLSANLLNNYLFPKSWPGAHIYSLMLNGNCDYNNPYPEP